MKRLITALLAVLLVTSTVHAAPVSWEFVTGGALQPQTAARNSLVLIPYFTATSTATSTVWGVLRINGLADSASSTGVSGQVLQSTGTSTRWVATSSLGIVGVGGSGTVYLASTTPWTVGNAAFVTGNGTLGSVATGTLTETVSGLSLDATRGLFGGSAVLSLDSGFTIPTTTLVTAMSAFNTTPSTRCVEITGNAGLCDGIDDTAAGGSGVGTTTPWITGTLAAVAGNSTLISTTSPVFGSFTATTTSLNNSIAGNLFVNGGTLELGSTTANRLIFDDVGIGAPSTTARSAGEKIVFYGDNTANKYAMGITGATLWYQTDSVHAWYQDGTEVMRLSPGQLLGLGTNLPSAKLDVVGDTELNGALVVTGATTLGSLTGNLRASAGVVSTGTVNVATEVTGVLPIANGGTGSSTNTLLAKPSAIQITSGAVPISTGDGKAYFRIPKEYNGMNLIDVDIAVTASSTSGVISVQLARGRQASAGVPHSYVDMLSTNVTIDANEYDSRTAATPMVINTSNDDVTEGDLIRIDLDAIGSAPTSTVIVQPVFALP